MSLGRRKVTLEDSSAWIFNRMAGVYSARPAYPLTLIETLHELAGSQGRVLDVGAGTGHLSLPLSARGLEVVAIDPARAMLERLQADAREQGLRLRSFHAAAEKLPMETATIDLVVLADVVHFLDKELASLEVARVLSKSGALAVVTSNFAETPFMSAVREIVNDSTPRRPREVTPAIEQFAAVVGADLTIVRHFQDENLVDPQTLEQILGSISFIGPAMNQERTAKFRARIQSLPLEPRWARTLTLYAGRRARKRGEPW